MHGPSYLQVGQQVSGRVTAIYDLGAVVEFWKHRGLIPPTEIADGEILRVGDHLAVGDSVQPWITNVDLDGQIDLTLVERRARTTVDTESMERIERIIALSLKGGEAESANRAVEWLAETKDIRAKRQVLGQLEAFVEQTLASEEATDEAVRFLADGGAPPRQSTKWSELDLALTLDAKLRQSIDPSWSWSNLRSVAGRLRRVPTRTDRLRRQIEDEQRRLTSLRRLGVTPGTGLPFWSMYMSRRSKKSWET